MKNITGLILVIINLIGVQSFAQDHAHHVKHNMVLFGDGNTYYASHIVYKEPHNFQVILKINLDSIVKEKVTSEMQAHPGDQVIYLLDHMDISKINAKPDISGQIFRIAADDSKQVIFEQVNLKANEYSIIYFDELPLSLRASDAQGLSQSFSLRKVEPLQCAKDDQRPKCCLPISNCDY